MQKKIVYIFLVPFLIGIGIKTAFSQKLDVKFGDISKADLEMKVYKPDPGADAVILSDYGYAELVESGDNLQVELVRNVRIKIINKGGYGYANVEIPYGSSDKIIKVEASTFNLEDGSIKETKVSKKSIIIDKANKYQRILRIAFPNVYEGSVIEYRYKYISESIYEFVPWRFQSDIPTIYTEFTASFPDFFSYRGVVKGDVSKISKKTEIDNVNFAGYYTSKNTHKWVGYSIPAFEEEPFITGRNDYLLKLDFEIVGINFPNRNYLELTPTYEKMSQKLLERDDFGMQLNSTNFIKRTTQKVINGISNNNEKLKAIHSYVSNEITWNGLENYTTSKSLKKVFYEKRGNSAEVNLILIAMLRQAGFTADPVILSTRSHGSLNQVYAMFQKFNYLIALVDIDGKKILVDACNPLLPYNTLPFECLNNQGRLISLTDSKWVRLMNNENKSEVSLFNITINNDGTFKGSLSQSFNHYDAYDIRRFIKLESKEGYDDFLKTKFSFIDINNIIINNVDSLYNPIKLDFEFTSKLVMQKIPEGYIFDPTILLGENNEHLFTSEERKHPIDFGCPISKVITINLTIPDNLLVDELPEKINLKLPENKGYYMFSCNIKNNVLSIQSKLSISEIRFKSEDYKLLREFFTQIIRKQSELVILKKKQ